MFEAVGKLGGQGTGNSKAKKLNVEKGKEGRIGGGKERATEGLWVRRVFVQVVCARKCVVHE